ncbi:MAG: helix-turn-helix transcriptional regulator [Niabella sp.]|nr:helix-turn-helix transcriptional regulator [Niabella sp.]
MTWYEQIKAARKKKELTQQEMADVCGLTLRSYQRIEVGAQWPAFPVLLSICTKLGIKAVNIR